ncbi:DNA-directed RNA polymerase specialized sigma subunit, sigma24 [Streptomyces sp. FR-008]|nr:DNA-directed RNA polymerase specialized sigma subunit, sigma24 [Streptomyces sp. FR-008]
MTKTDPAGWLTRDAYTALRPPLARAAAAEAVLTGLDAADLEQAAWLRLLEQAKAQGPPADPRPGLLAAVRSEARAALGTLRREGTGPRRPARWPPARRLPRGPVPEPGGRRRVPPGGRRAHPALPHPGRRPALRARSHVPRNRRNVGYLTGQRGAGTFPLPGMPAQNARDGGWSSWRGGNGAIDNRRNR